MKRVLVLLIGFMGCFFLKAVAQDIIYSKRDGREKVKYARYGRYEGKEQIKESKEFFKSVLKVKEQDTFKIITNRKGPLFHERFQQYYKGIKVEHGGYALHYKDNLIISANGQYLRVNPLDVTPVITEKEAIEFYAKICGVTQYIILKKPELIICKGNDNSEDELLLAYKVYLSSDSISIKEIGYINAIDGSLIKTEPNIVCLSSTGTISTIYNGTLSTNTSYYNGSYHLCDSTRNLYSCEKSIWSFGLILNLWC